MTRDHQDGGIDLPLPALLRCPLKGNSRACRYARTHNCSYINVPDRWYTPRTIHTSLALICAHISSAVAAAAAAAAAVRSDNIQFFFSYIYAGIYTEKATGDRGRSRGNRFCGVVFFIYFYFYDYARRRRRRLRRSSIRVCACVCASTIYRAVRSHAHARVQYTHTRIIYSGVRLGQTAAAVQHGR